MNEHLFYAWAAGFIEADGSFSLRVYKRCFNKGDNKYWRYMVQPVVQASQHNPAPLERLAEGTGTKSISSKPCRGNPSWGIQIVGRDRLLKFLNGIRPHLTQKIEQCDLLLEVIDRQGGKGANGYSDEDWSFFFNAKEEIIGLNANREYKRPNVEYDPKGRLNTPVEVE